MPGTRIPDATDALIARFTAVQIPGVEVVDGPEFNAEGDFLAVGWTNSNGPMPTVAGSNQSIDYALYEGMESFDIQHLLRIWVGDEILGDARRRLFGYFNQYYDALAADFLLGGIVMQSWVSAYDMTPNLTSDGGYLDLMFTVTCKASTNPLPSPPPLYHATP